jgi:hypothetical protein
MLAICEIRPRTGSSGGTLWRRSFVFPSIISCITLYCVSKQWTTPRYDTELSCSLLCLPFLSVSLSSWQAAVWKSTALFCTRLCSSVLNLVYCFLAQPTLSCFALRRTGMRCPICTALRDLPPCYTVSILNCITPPCSALELLLCPRFFFCPGLSFLHCTAFQCIAPQMWLCQPGSALCRTEFPSCIFSWYRIIQYVVQYFPLAYILHLLDSYRFSKHIFFPRRF